jgi:transposase-like protein
MRTSPRPKPIARSAFAGFCFPSDVIVLAVRWYLRFSLSYRDVEELLAERGIEVDHVTIYRWVLRFSRLLAEAARPCHRPVRASHRRVRLLAARRRSSSPFLRAGYLCNHGQAD